MYRFCLYVIKQKGAVAGREQDTEYSTGTVNNELYFVLFSSYDKPYFVTYENTFNVNRHGSLLTTVRYKSNVFYEKI